MPHAEDLVANVETHERAVAEFHAARAAGSVKLWRSGLSYLYRMLPELSGNVDRGSTKVWSFQTVLLTQSTRALRTSFVVTMHGYYGQGRALHRIPEEAVLGYWYLQNFPDELPAFFGDKPPEWNHMLQKIEALPGVDQDSVRRVLRRQLNPYLHASALSALIGSEHLNSDAVLFSLTPRPDARLFREVTAAAAIQIRSVLAAGNHHLKVIGQRPPPYQGLYQREIKRWNQGVGLLLRPTLQQPLKRSVRRRRLRNERGDS